MYVQICVILQEPKQRPMHPHWLPGLLFKGGYNIQMFVGLAGSHVYIYFFDHYRVLRSIQSCNYADKMVDWWTQWLMCIPCGFMLACVVFKVGQIRCSP